MAKKVQSKSQMIRFLARLRRSNARSKRIKTRRPELELLRVRVSRGFTNTITRTRVLLDVRPDLKDQAFPCSSENPATHSVASHTWTKRGIGTHLARYLVLTVHANGDLDEEDWLQWRSSGTVPFHLVMEPDCGIFALPLPDSVRDSTGNPPCSHQA
jgi:hypothetical protein